MAPVGVGLLATVFLFWFATHATASGPEPMTRYHWTVMSAQTSGSGFAVAQGIVATNAHVVRGLAVGKRVRLLAPAPQRHRVRGRLLAVSPNMDLALIAVSASDMFVASERVQRLKAGTRVFAVGARINRGHARVQFSSGQMRTGQIVIRSYGPGGMARFGEIGPGFSGGPVFDAKGRLVGMVSAVTQAPVGRAGMNDAFLISAIALTTETRRLLGSFEMSAAGPARIP